MAESSDASLRRSSGESTVNLGGSATIPDEEWDDALAINLLSAVRATRAALPALRAAPTGAAIVNISSAATRSRPAPLLHYAAAKAALVTYSRGLAAELAPSASGSTW